MSSADSHPTCPEDALSAVDRLHGAGALVPASLRGTRLTLAAWPGSAGADLPPREGQPDALRGELPCRTHLQDWCRLLCHAQHVLDVHVQVHAGIPASSAQEAQGDLGDGQGLAGGAVGLQQPGDGADGREGQGILGGTRETRAMRWLSGSRFPIGGALLGRSRPQAGPPARRPQRQLTGCPPRPEAGQLCTGSGRGRLIPSRPPLEVHRCPRRN